MSKQESFPALGIDRGVVSQAVGYALGPKLSDDQMRKIASEFGNALMTPWNWNILAYAVECVVDVDHARGMVTIKVESGVVTTVRGLPKNYQYEILDHDVMEPATAEPVLDTSPEAGQLLQDLRESLRRVRDGVTDLGGTSYHCFPFGFSQGNVSCRGEGSDPNSPVCVLCRKLHNYEWVYTKESEQ